MHVDDLWHPLMSWMMKPMEKTLGYPKSYTKGEGYDIFVQAPCKVRKGTLPKSSTPKRQDRHASLACITTMKLLIVVKFGSVTQNIMLDLVRHMRVVPSMRRPMLITVSCQNKKPQPRVERPLLTRLRAGWVLGMLLLVLELLLAGLGV